MIGQRVKEIRLVLGFSQVEFADQLCTSKGQISNIESGNKSPSATLLELIIFKFGVNRDWLIDGKGMTFEEVQPAKPSLSSKAMVTAAVVGTAFPQVSVGLIATVGAAKLVKKLCGAYGVENQSELASKCFGIRKSTVSNWIQQDKVPEKYVYKALRETGVSVDDLVDEEVFSVTKSEMGKVLKRLVSEPGISGLTVDELSDLWENTFQKIKSFDN
nr:helix-turn-helix transcriptional regulator [uncultured Desulfuromonas sp.]